MSVRSFADQEHLIVAFAWAPRSEASSSPRLGVDPIAAPAENLGRGRSANFRLAAPFAPITPVVETLEDWLC
jgi:hypothetical protein